MRLSLLSPGLVLGVAAPALGYAVVVLLGLKASTAGRRWRATVSLIAGHLACLGVLAALLAAAQPGAYLHAVEAMLQAVTVSPMAQLACALLMALPLWSVLSSPAPASARRERRSHHALDPGGGAARLNGRSGALAGLPASRLDPAPAPPLAVGAVPTPAAAPSGAVAAVTGAPVTDAPVTPWPAAGPLTEEPPTSEPLDSPGGSRRVAPLDVDESVAPLDGDESRLAITFGRVRSQLPEKAFGCPLDELGPRLTTPGCLLVPRALVESQLPEGLVTVSWALVADQFPRPAVLWAEPEIVARLVGGALQLPLDEVVARCWATITDGALPSASDTDLTPFPDLFHPAAPSAADDRPPVVPTPLVIAGVERVMSDAEQTAAEEVAVGESVRARDGVDAAADDLIPAVAPEAEPSLRRGADLTDDVATLVGRLRDVLERWRVGPAFAWDACAVEGRPVVALAGNGHAPRDLARVAGRLAHVFETDTALGAVTEIDVRRAGATVVVLRHDVAAARGPLVTASVSGRGTLAFAEMLCRRIVEGCGGAPAVREAVAAGAAPAMTDRLVRRAAGPPVRVIAPAGRDADDVAAAAQRLFALVEATALESEEDGADEVSARLAGDVRLTVRPLDDGGAAGALLALLSPAGLPRGQGRRWLARVTPAGPGA